MNLFQFDSRIDFFQCDSKNWIWLKGLNLYFHSMTQRIEPSFSTWLKELNLLSKYDSKNWTFFSTMTQKIELSFRNIETVSWKYDSKIWTSFLIIWLKELNLLSDNMTQRIELFVIISLKELNFFFLMWLEELNPFYIWLKELNFFLNLTQRIEPFLWIWLKELNHFLNVTLRIEPLFFLIWLKELNTFFIWFRELNFFFLKNIDSKNWTFFFNMTQKIEYDSKDWIFFWFNMTHRIFFQKNVSKNCTLFFSVWLRQLNPLFEHVSMTWTLFDATQRIEPFFFEYDSQNWTLCFLNMIHRIEPFVSWIWFTELNFFENMTHRIELETFLKLLKELKLFWYDSKNWNFSDMTQRIETFVYKT